MSVRNYAYVGPPEIRDAVASVSPGVPIRNRAELLAWLTANSADAGRDGGITATFVVDPDGILRLADRRSEHVACAAGGPVLSAGEITFTADGDVDAVSNQSTGFCPDPESWVHVATALDQIPVAHPDQFTTSVVFRLCTACNSRNIVKDDWFVCDVCGGELPADWNFPVDVSPPQGMDPRL